jgi:hypothetical protein
MHAHAEQTTQVVKPSLQVYLQSVLLGFVRRALTGVDIIRGVDANQRPENWRRVGGLGIHGGTRTGAAAATGEGRARDVRLEPSSLTAVKYVSDGEKNDALNRGRHHVFQHQPALLALRRAPVGHQYVDKGGLEGWQRVGRVDCRIGSLAAVPGWHAAPLAITSPAASSDIATAVATAIATAVVITAATDATIATPIATTIATAIITTTTTTTPAPTAIHSAVTAVHSAQSPLALRALLAAAGATPAAVTAAVAVTVTAAAVATVAVTATGIVIAAVTTVAVTAVAVASPYITRRVWTARSTLL